MDTQTSLFQYPRILVERLSSQLKTSNFLPTTTNGLILAVASGLGKLFAVWLYTDYRAWVAFGTGGTPPTVAGYWFMTKVRIARMFSTDNLRDASLLRNDAPRFLVRPVPQRQRRRPTIQARTMPQRQHPVPLDSAARTRLLDIPRKYVAAYPDSLEVHPSKVEGGTTDAIYAKPGLEKRPASATDHIVGNEMAHVHPAENSLHVWLSEPDARAVVEAGWGERFPLSESKKVHRGFIFIYAPESMEEVLMIEKIVEASIAYVTGEKI